MLEVVAEKKVVKIKLADGAKQIVHRIARENDMTQEGVAGRIYQWFAEQPAILQRWILGHIDEELRPDALKRIATHFQRQMPFTGDGTPMPSDQKAESAEHQSEREQRQKRKATG